MEQVTPLPYLSRAGIAWPVRTERLTIRPAREEDSEALWAYHRLDEVAAWLTYRPADRDDWKAILTAPDQLSRTLVIERDGRVVGDLFLKIEAAWAQREVRDRAQDVHAEVGWCLDPAHSGQGYATEAAEALLRLCFVDLGLRRVVANAFADNAPSVRVMERLGMRREAYTVRDSLHRDLGWLDGVCYALLADEWNPAPTS